MKNFRYLFLALITLSVVSCSGEDDSPSAETSNLVGEWKLEDLNYTGSTSFNFDGTSISTDFSGELLESDATIILRENNTWTSSGSYTLKLTSNTEGMIDTEEVPVSNLDGSGTYSVNGNILTTEHEAVEFDGSFDLSPMEIGEAVITELTENRMVLTFDTTEIMDMNGMEMEIVMQGVQILTR